jgi:voltage-gated potassium channel
MPPETPRRPWRIALHNVVFESDTWAGKAFDRGLLLAVLVSVAVVILDSVAALHARFGGAFWALEWLFTILFTLEYVARLLAVRHPLRYAVSFFGIIDLLAFLPTYLSLIVPGAQFFLAVRTLRMLRMFQVLQMSAYTRQGEFLRLALIAGWPKIAVFLTTLACATVILGAAMFLIEGEAHGFTSIPMGIYWATVTMTTVGFGDIVPRTVAGQALATCVSILGYAIIAVPTGILSMELSEAARQPTAGGIACPSCGRQGHDVDAAFCKICGHALEA